MTDEAQSRRAGAEAPAASGSNAERDCLGYRACLGVLVPATNTVVQDVLARYPDVVVQSDDILGRVTRYRYQRPLRRFRKPVRGTLNLGVITI